MKIIMIMITITIELLTWLATSWRGALVACDVMLSHEDNSV